MVKPLIQNDLKLVEAEVTANERTKLDIEELLHDKQLFVNQVGELQIKQEGLTVIIAKQKEQLQTLDIEVERKKLEEQETLKQTSQKGRESSVVLSKVSTSLKANYQQQELLTLEAQYQSMQNSLEQELALSQEKLAKELQETKALTERIEENPDLKVVREVLKSSKEETAQRKLQQNQLSQSIQQYESSIAQIDT